MTPGSISPLTHPWTSAARDPFSFCLTPHQNDRDHSIPCPLQSGILRRVIALAYLPFRPFGRSVTVISLQEAVKMRREQMVQAFETWRVREAMVERGDSETVRYHGQFLPAPILKIEDIREREPMKSYLAFIPGQELTFNEVLYEIYKY